MYAEYLEALTAVASPHAAGITGFAVDIRVNGATVASLDAKFVLWGLQHNS
jgi:hypothetical protein